MEHITHNKFGTMHLIAELAVFSGMFYYFNKKINKLETENQHIKKTYVDTFEDVYKKIDLLKEGIVQLQSLQSQQTNQLFSQSNKPQGYNQDTVYKNIQNIQNKNTQIKSNQEVKPIKPQTSQDDIKEQHQQTKTEQVNLIKIEVPVQIPSFEKLHQDLNQSIASDLIDFLQGSNATQSNSENITLTNITDPDKVEVLDDLDESEETKINEKSVEVSQNNEKNEKEESQTLSQSDFDEINKLLE
jgi:hypothetical protein